MNIDDIRNIEIGFPETNRYFEQTSIDGYAFLGIARHILGQDTTDVEKKMENMKYGLNAPHRIRETNLPPDEPYVYSCFSAYMFYDAIGRTDKIEDIVDTLDKIGKYDNGMMRYCNTEINYIIPNVTPLAALVYQGVKRYHDAKQLLSALKNNQNDNGNWSYSIPCKNILPQEEDSTHLCMMTYAIDNITNPIADSIISRTLPCIFSMNNDKISPGSIGWGYPWLTMVSKWWPEMQSKAIELTIQEMLNPESNFRVRALSKWALAFIEVTEQ